jgi:gliding motility-associated-like protein
MVVPLNSLPLNFLRCFLAVAGVVVSGFHLSVSAQWDTDMGCVVVNAAGNATVSWAPVSDPSGDFQHYGVYYFEPADVLPIGNVQVGNDGGVPNPNTSSWVNTLYSANQFELCYTLVPQATTGSGVSDTICSIHLDVQPGLVSGIAELTFNSPHIATGEIGNDLVVQREDGPGSWSDVATVPDNGGMMTFDYAIEACSEDLKFRVTSDGPVSLGCDHISNQSSISISNILAPDPPIITDIDVDPATGNAIINWTQEPADDLEGFIIYTCSGNLSQAVDTIFDPTATSWENPNSNATSYVEFYNIAAFDSCATSPDGVGNTSVGPTCVGSLEMDVARNPCDDFAELNWAGPYATAGDIVGYEVLMWQESPAGSGNVTGPVTLANLEPTVTAFTHTDAVYGDLYQYVIHAHHSTGATSTSDVEVLDFTYPGAPEYISLRRASVRDSGGVDIIVDLDPSVNIVHTYMLERAQYPGGTFFPMTEQDGVGGMTLTWTDSWAKTDELSYSYRVVARNPCGDSVQVSNEAKTILLHGTTDPALLRNALTWTEYLEFPGSVAAYEIFRRPQRDGVFSLLTSIPEDVFTHEDDVSAALELAGDFCYRIRATDSAPGPSGSQNYALSNTFCLTQEPVVWVPNSFMVGGFNDRFAPVISFADSSAFEMQIFNRWGQTLFTTTDAEAGWDGSVDGLGVDFMPEGSYGYFIRVQDGAGRKFDESGLVYLLRGD